MSKRWRVIGVVLVIAVLGALVVIGLRIEGPPVPTPPRDVIPPQMALIDQDDLPNAWGSGSRKTDIYEVPYGMAAERIMRLGFERPWINVLERVYSYTDEVLAAHAYDEQRAKYEQLSLHGWEEVPISEFAHQANEAHIACLESVINGLHHYHLCSYIARYETIVIDVGGNIFDRRWLTKEQFRDVLIIADRKAVATLEGTPEDASDPWAQFGIPNWGQRSSIPGIAGMVPSGRAW
jgi:hypothetical protein